MDVIVVPVTDSTAAHQFDSVLPSVRSAVSITAPAMPAKSLSSNYQQMNAILKWREFKNKHERRRDPAPASSKERGILAMLKIPPMSQRESSKFDRKDSQAMANPGNPKCTLKFDLKPQLKWRVRHLRRRSPAFGSVM